PVTPNVRTGEPSRSSPLPLLSELASGPERPPRQIHNSQAAASTAAVAVTINGGMTKIQSASPPVASKTLITRVLVGYALRRQVPGVRRTLSSLNFDIYYRRLQARLTNLKPEPTAQVIGVPAVRR